MTNDAQRDAEGWVNIFRRAIEQARNGDTGGNNLGNGFGPNTPNAARTQVTRVVQLDLNVAGRSVPVTTDPLSAETLLSNIASAKARAG